MEDRQSTGAPQLGGRGTKQEDLLGKRGCAVQKPREPGLESWLREGHARFDAEDLW